MNSKAAKNLFLIAFAAETFLASYGLLLGSDAAIVSVFYCVAGAALVYSLLFLPEIRLDLQTRSGSSPGNRWKWILAAVMIFLAFISSRYWLYEIPIDPDFADMLPVIRVMNERFLAGHWKQIYDPIGEIWNGARPVYLPAMWMPYLPAVFFHLDMRWVTVGCLLFCFGAFLFIIRIGRKDVFAWLIIAVAAMLFWWIFSRDDVHGVISLSEEGPVILFHVLLCFAIASGNIYFIAISAALCLLSRYCMIGWIIPFLMILIMRGQYRKAFTFSLTGIGFFLIFFLIPFGADPVRQLIRLPSGYIAFASRVWNDASEVFWLNLGLAKFFGPHHITLLHEMLIGCSFLVPPIFALSCLVYKKRKLNNISLATLKLSLVIFFQFIDVPYGYLFYTSSFVSLVIAGMLKVEPEAERLRSDV